MAILFVLITCILMQLRNNVYKSARMQSLHTISLMMCITFTVFKILIYGLSRYSKEISEATKTLVDRDYWKLSRDYRPYSAQEEIEPYLALEERKEDILISTYIFFGLAALYWLYFLWTFYVLFLVWLVESKQFNWFKVFTCCRWDMRKFVRSNVLRDAHMAGMKSLAVDGQEAGVFPDDSEFHIYLDNTQGPLIKGESDSATGSDRNLIE